MTATHLVLLQGARVDHWVVSLAVVIATGVSATGHREISGLMVGDSESKPFRTRFPRSLQARGLGNVQLEISDSHSGLMAAIRTLSTVRLGSRPCCWMPRRSRTPRHRRPARRRSPG
ncbi:transposase [Streptomyces shenzhenensis]|uniref:transposase n=1 Tax=Streptomyces shenzhenensis TaxID=943815 RepID=UPI0026C141EA